MGTQFGVPKIGCPKLGTQFRVPNFGCPKPGTPKWVHKSDTQFARRGGPRADRAGGGTGGAPAGARWPAPPAPRPRGAGAPAATPAGSPGPPPAVRYACALGLLLCKSLSNSYQNTIILCEHPLSCTVCTLSHAPRRASIKPNLGYPHSGCPNLVHRSWVPKFAYPMSGVPKLCSVGVNDPIDDQKESARSSIELQMTPQNGRKK